jgi:hypothetical protein
MMWLSGALLLFAADVLLHAIVCRLPIPLNIVLRFAVVGGAIGIAWIWWLYSTYGIHEPQFWAGVLIYAFCCELYIFLFTLVIGSISANLLVSLSSHQMSTAEIDRHYDSGKMVAARIERLISVGFISETAAGLVITRKGKRTVRIFNLLRGFFRHPQLSFDRPSDD